MSLRVSVRPVALRMMALLGACIVSPWAWYHQCRIHKLGRDLTMYELEICKRLGVLAPRSVRVIEVDVVPNPLRKLSGLMREKLSRLMVVKIDGITLGQGIYVRKACAKSVSLIAHELVHIRQYQQSGSIWKFTHEYIYQCLTDGYYMSRWEIEARRDSVAAIN